MLEIDNTLVSLDLIERSFACDLSQCKGICCVEGDAGAPLEKKEYQILQDLLPIIWDDLSPKAQKIIEKQGVGYIDEDGEIVTSIVDNKDCVFTCYDAQGVCSCAIEKAYLEKRVSFIKPISCHLYPIRISHYKNYLAVNFHRWKICQCAEVRGRKEQIPVYRFLKEPLIRKFGEKWYASLDECVQEYLKQKL